MSNHEYDHCDKYNRKKIRFREGDERIETKRKYDRAITAMGDQLEARITQKIKPNPKVVFKLGDSRGDAAHVARQRERRRTKQYKDLEFGGR